MKTKTLALVLIVLLSVTASAWADTGGSYDLAWGMVVSGGGTLSGGAYQLDTTIAQPAAGVTQSGGGYALNGGVVDAGSSGEVKPYGQQVFLPLIVR